MKKMLCFVMAFKELWGYLPTINSPLMKIIYEVKKTADSSLHFLLHLHGFITVGKVVDDGQ